MSAGPMSETFTLRHHRTSRDLTVEVQYRRREWGGWFVTRADNGRILGWLFKDGRHWSACASAEAYRGAGPDDTGDPLDKVPGNLTACYDGVHHNPVAVRTSTRWEATYNLLAHLVRNQAPALGFPRHNDVKQYERRW